MSKPAVADTEPFPFRQELQETIFEAIKGWEVRLPGKPLRGTTGADAEAIAQAIREVYVDGLRNSGSAGQHYLAMRGEVVQAHNELDRVSIERSEDGAIHSLPHRVAILAGRYVDEQRRHVELEHAPAGEVPAGTKELHVVLAQDGDSPHMQFVELEDQDGRGVGRFERREADGLVRIVIPYGRDDAWVTEVAYQAAGAASGVFLREDGEKVMPSREVADAVAELLAEGFGIPRACEDCAQDRLTIGQVAGQHWGKTEAMREKIREDAATPEDAEAAIRELESTGRAFMNGAGQHVGTQGGEPSDDRPPTDDAEEPEDGPFSGSLEIRIGPDGYPWIGVLGLIELFEKLGCAAYRDEEIAEPGPEEADLEGEIDPDVPLWRVEVSRAFDHLLNAARVGFRV